MKNHFDKNLNVKELLLSERPKRFLELGAHVGANTRQIVGVQVEAGIHEIITISDGKCPADLVDTVRWIAGISYLELPKFPDNYFDFASIDTDHNGWTLKQEMDLLERKLGIGGVLVIHDTTAYGDANGLSGQYGCGIPYPMEEASKYPYTYGQILRHKLAEGKWDLIRETKESQGAVALRRVM